MSTTLLVESLVTVAQVVLAIRFFVHNLPERDRFLSRLALLALAGLVGTLAAVALGLAAGVGSESAPLPIHIEWAPFLVLLMFSVAAVMVLYHVRLWSALFCCTMGYTIQNLWAGINRLATMGLTAWLGVTELPASTQIAVSLSTCLLVYYFSWRYYALRATEHNLATIEDKRMAVFGLLVVLFCIFFNSMVNSFPALGAPFGITVFMSFTHVIICQMLLSFEIGLPAAKQLEDQVTTISRVLEAERRQYELSRDTINALNIKAHDLKHQIHFLRNRASQPVDALLLDTLAADVALYESLYHTGCEALDVILSEKSLKAKQLGVSLNCIIDGEALLFMAEADIYSLFGNALDNALEAVQKLPQDERAPVGVTVKRRLGMVAIHIENVFDGSINLEGELPKTSKGDTRSHGYGTLSMKVLAHKYGGTFAFRAHENTFELNIVLPLPEPALDEKSSMAEEQELPPFAGAATA